MTLLLIEGFDDGLTAYRWAAAQGSLLDPGRTGGKGWQVPDNDQVMNFTIPAANEHATLTVGFAFRFSALPTNDVYFLQLNSDAGATAHTVLGLLDSGLIEVRRGTGAVTPLATTMQALLPNNWYHIEFKATLGDSAAAYELRINGVNRASGTGDTKNGGTKTVYDTVKLAGDSDPSGITLNFDDLHITNGAGSVRNSFLGDFVVETLVPNGNGTYSQLVGSDADSIDNYLLVDELTASMVDYVGSATDGQKDSYALANLIRTVGTVLGVEVRALGWKTDSGAKSVRPIVRSGTVDASGTDGALAVLSPQVVPSVWEQNPDGTVDWTITSVNALEAGAEVRP